jgi:hypothetical protein
VGQQNHGRLGKARRGCRERSERSGGLMLGISGSSSLRALGLGVEPRRQVQAPWRHEISQGGRQV